MLAERDDAAALAAVFRLAAEVPNAHGHALTEGGVGQPFARFEGVPDIAAEWIATSFDSSSLYLLVVNLFLFVVGMFVETSASIIVLAPILAEAAEKLGIDQVHFGTIMVVNLALGMITPPFGVNLFAAAQVARCGVDQMMRYLWIFIAVVFGALMVITYVPWITLSLPHLVFR